MGVIWISLKLVRLTIVGFQRIIILITIYVQPKKLKLKLH